MVNDLENSAMVPSTKGILTINQIANLQGHPPVKILGLGHILRNLERGLIHSSSLFIDIIQVLYLKIRLIAQ